MKLILKEPFTLEVGEDTYNGELVSLTRKQLAKINKISPTQAIKEAQKFSKKLDNLREKYSLNKDEAKKLQILSSIEKLESMLDIINTDIEAFDIEDIYKERMNISLMGEDKKAIMELGETYGYKKVFNTILEDIKERNEKN